MEIQFKLSIKEFKDIFVYEQLHNDGAIKYKRKAKYFVDMYIIGYVICFIFLSDFKEYSDTGIHLIIFIIFSVLLVLGLIVISRVLFKFANLFKLKRSWNKAKRNINFLNREILVCVNNDHIIFYENEDKQYKVSLKNIEIPRIDKTKIYLKIEGRTLYYIPLNAFSSEAQKNEFINLIRSK